VSRLNIGLLKCVLILTGQLQKMGILPSAQPVKTPVSAKRKSTQIDFGNLAPLNTNAAGTKNFAGYRDTAGPSSSKAKDIKSRAADAMDSDVEDDDEPDAQVREDPDDSKDPIKLLSPEEALQEEKLSEDVRKIKVYHSYHRNSVHQYSHFFSSSASIPLNH
jgi:hypothetical protein